MGMENFVNASQALARTSFSPPAGMESAVKENSLAAESRRVRVTDTLGFSCM
jgi:hypothetical protein